MSFSFPATSLDPHSTQQTSPNSMHHQHYMSPLTGSSSSSTGGSPTTAAQVQAAAAASNMPLLASIANVKDSRWLTLEVCREYQRGKCTRSEQECKFAHPPTHVEVNSGKVIACFDSLKVCPSASTDEFFISREPWFQPAPSIWILFCQNSALLNIVEKKRLMSFPTLLFFRPTADESVQQNSSGEWFFSWRLVFQIKSANLWLWKTSLESIRLRTSIMFKRDDDRTNTHKINRWLFIYFRWTSLKTTTFVSIATLNTHVRRTKEDFSPSRVSS